MNRTVIRLLAALPAAGCLGLALAAGPVAPQAPNPQPPAAAADRTKRQVESPAERLAAGAAAAAPAAGGEAFVNPPVPPGKVHWHPDFATACRAAAQSGKPVLLFQMMGRLDQKFC
jgi:hypothetical protein